MFYLMAHSTQFMYMASEHICSQKTGARCNSVVKRALIVRWVLESIPHGGPIELLLVPASVSQLV